MGPGRWQVNRGQLIQESFQGKTQLRLKLGGKILLSRFFVSLNLGVFLLVVVVVVWIICWLFYIYICFCLVCTY